MRSLSDEEILFPEIVINNITILPWTFDKLFKLNTSLRKLSKCVECINSLTTNVKYIDVLKLLSFINKDISRVMCITLNCSEKDVLEFDLYTGLKILVTIYFQNINIINSKKSEKKGATLSLGDVFSTLISNNIGDSIEDLKSNYTIDQVYMFYEKCRKNELSEQKRNAVTLAHALVYASPSHDRNSMRKKQNMWDKYINSLEPRKAEKPSSKNIINVFRMMGIPVVKKEVNK